MTQTETMGLSRVEVDAADSVAIPLGFVDSQSNRHPLTAPAQVSSVVSAPTGAGSSTVGPFGETQAAAQAAVAAAAPRIYYGWYMLLLAMVAAIATSPGQTFGVSIFNEPMRLELNLTHGQLALAYTLGTLLGAIPITWIGGKADRIGLRRALLLVLAMFGGACLVMAATLNWIMLVVGFTLLRMLGPGGLSLLSSNILPFWFQRRLGTLEGFRQTAMALGMAVIPAVNLWLVLAIGWRGAYLLMGCGLVMLLPVFWLWFRNHPREVGQFIDGRRKSETSRRPAIDVGATIACPITASTVPSSGVAPAVISPAVIPTSGPDAAASSLALDEDSDSSEWEVHSYSLRDACVTPVFWIVVLASALFALIHTGVFFSLVPILEEHGLQAGHGALLLMTFAVSLAVHQLLGGWIADRVAPAWQMAVGQLLFAIGLGMLYAGYGLGPILFAGVLMGAAQGIFFAAANPLWARYFGLRHLGSIRGFLMSFNVALSAMGPLLVGWFHDLFGNFHGILLAFALSPLLFAFSCLLVRPPRKSNPMPS